jgi:acetyl-CoA carboxylase carboxyl transferase subunit alpha
MISDPNGILTGTVSGPRLTQLEFEKPLARIEEEIASLEAKQADTGRDFSKDIREMRAHLKNLTRRTFDKLTPWETVLVARHPNRPLLPHYLQMMVRDFCELHGDRSFRDDRAIISGFGRISGQKCMIIGHNKGRDTKEKIACHFGCAHPEGYRKSLLKMKLAEKFGLPIVTLIDTQGAYPGIGAEERGIAQAIAVNLKEMSRLRTPIICVVIGEGGSGGALGIGVGDKVAMFQHSFYSVISPEGAAAILWKTNEKAKQAAEALKITSKELVKLGVVDDVIDEPLGGAHRDPQQAANNLKQYLSQSLRDLKRLKIETVLNRRHERLRNMGSFFESGSNTPPRNRSTAVEAAQAGRKTAAAKTAPQTSTPVVR